MLYYEKVSGGETEKISALWKYLLAAEAFLAQPNVELYYDIFRAARAVPIVRRLAEATKDLGPGLPASKSRRLVAEVEYDAFDQAAYEIIVAHAYKRANGVEQVEFISETDKPTPDLRITGSGVKLSVECKKFDRSRDIAGPVRDEVNNRLEPAFAMLRANGVSALVELDVREPNARFDPREVANACIASLASGVAIFTSTATVRCYRLQPYESKNVVLCPSPLFFKRYAYSHRSEWFGIAHRMQATRAGPSWVDDIKWDAAVKWKLSSPAHKSSRRRLGHGRLFKGIRQLSTTVGPTVLHVCYEREGGIGHRREELDQFVSRVGAALERNELASPTAVVFNEIDIDVSEGGRFDFIERAHWRRFQSHVTGPPPVSVVFVPPKESVPGGEWGIGLDLPSIDDSVEGES